MPRVRFQPTIPVYVRAQTFHALLDCAAIDLHYYCALLLSCCEIGFETFYN
jgi:hypothetical protein